MLQISSKTTPLLLVALCLIRICRPGLAADQPQWGQRDSRNMVSAETGLPTTFDPGTRGRQGNMDLPANSGVRWVARLGNNSYGSPVVAGGRVYVGTNNDAPRDPRMQGDRGVLMCFDEKTGEFLWQLCLPKLTKIKWSDWQQIGLTSTPVVEGDRAYVVSNRGEVLCLDVHGMANGNQGPFADEGRLMAEEGQPPVEPGPKDADVLWSFDMPGRLNVTPHNGSNCSVLLHGELLYVCTSQGVDWTHMYVPHPEAPSIIVIDKQTGKLVGRDDFRIGLDITHGQWSSPGLGVVNGKTELFFGAGNGIFYAFEPLGAPPASDPPALLKNIWRFHGHPLAQKQAPPPADHQHDSTSYEMTAMPVFHKDRVYAMFTQEPHHNMRAGYVACLDATKTGDVTRGGLVWAYDQIGSGESTVAVADGLVYAAGFDGRLHCLDAETGKCYWVHEAGGQIWGSPLVADGKVYLGSGGKQTLWVLAAGKELKVISRIRMRDGIYSTPTAANGTLFVMTNKHLYAVGK
jgi:outer membrane protein assembly factor BamB